MRARRAIAGIERGWNCATSSGLAVPAADAFRRAGDETAGSGGRGTFEIIEGHDRGRAADRPGYRSSHHVGASAMILWDHGNVCACLRQTLPRLSARRPLPGASRRPASQALSDPFRREPPDQDARGRAGRGGGSVPLSIGAAVHSHRADRRRRPAIWNDESNILGRTRLDSATRELRARAGRSTLRCGSRHFSQTSFPAPSGGPARRQPEIDLEIDTGRHGTDVHRGCRRVDRDGLAGRGRDLHAHRLFAQTYVPACSPALFARTPIHTIEQLDGQTLLVFEARKDAWELWAESAGAQLPPLANASTSHMAVAGPGHGSARRRRAGLRSPQHRAIPGEVAHRLFEHELDIHDSYFLVHRERSLAGRK